jgi:ABC-type sugar transport system ATPase subunit
MSDLLQLRAICKSFGGVTVLDRVDFDVRTGEVHALVGENGAGKSTLMNIVSGVLPADSGQIIWLGRPVAVRSPHAAQELGIGFVHQELALVPQLSVAENIFLGRHPAARGWVQWGRMCDRAGALLEQLGHPIDPRRPVAGLSLAEQQLVEIARSLAFQTRLIIMDEPTAPLAEHDAERLFRTIRRLRERGVSVIFISHRLKEIFQVSNRVTVMRDGKRVLTTDTAATGLGELVRAMVGNEMAAASSHETTGHTENDEAIRLEGDLKIAVRRGEVVGLAGLTGAGRTKLLESLFGAGRHPRRLFVNGLPVSVRTPRDAIRNGIALVPDDRKTKGLIPGASLRLNIALASGRNRLFLRAAEESRSARRLLDELRIKAASLDQPVLNLSGGNQQKAVLAKWLLAGATVFLLDEPTRGIDVRAKADVYDLIRGLARQGAAVVLASSEIEELLLLADRIVVMHRGQLAGELMRREATEERIMQLATGGES